MSALLNFQVLKENSSNAPIEFRYNETFNQEFLSRGSEWEVSVTKLSLPSSQFETFYMGDRQQDYSVGIVGSNPVTKKYNEYTEFLPDDRDVVSQVYSYGKIKYYSGNQVLEMMSRSLYIAYMNYVKSFGTGYKENKKVNLLFPLLSKILLISLFQNF